MESDVHLVETLDRDECLNLLRSHRLGRIGLTAGALPVVLPVNYAVCGDNIVIRIHAASKVEAGRPRMVVAFEVDDLDEHGETGWTVLVTGIAEKVSDHEDLECFRRLSLGPWTTGGDEFVTISTELMVGHRVVLPAWQAMA